MAASEWTCAQVGKWLKKNGFTSYVDLFIKKHKIDGKALLTLTETDLKQPPLEITILGDVKRLMIAIRKVQAESGHVVDELGINNGSPPSLRSPKQVIIHEHRYPSYHRLDSTKSLYSDDSQDFDETDHGTWKRQSATLEPEFLKLILSFVYMFAVFLLTSFVMVIVHDRVPDMEKYPPLPDIVLDNLPFIPWAFQMCEMTGCILSIVCMVTLVFHKHRFIILRRLFSMTGTVFMLRCVTMLITSLSVPSANLKCQPKVYGDLWSKLQRAFVIWRGFGMTLQGVKTCGDYMFSGHTIVITILNFFITEYTPRRMHMLHTTTWVLNLFGIFFILAAHEHYSIDVFVAFYITSRLFLYYHSLANNRALTQADRRRTRIWFPMFSYFESKCNGIVPNEYEWPFKWPKFLEDLLRSKKSS